MARPRRLITVVLLALPVAAVFLGRDLPRRWLETQLAEASEATVRLGGLRIHSLEHVELVELTVEHPATLPGLRRLEVAQVEVVASLAELRRGVIRQLHLSGARAVLEPAGRLLEASSELQGAGHAPFRIRRLVAPGARLLTLRGSEQPAEGSLDLSLWQVEGSWIGSIDMRAEAIELTPWLAAFGWTDFAARARHLEARLRLRAAPGLGLVDARSSHLLLQHRATELDFAFSEPRFDGQGLPPRHGELSAAELRLDSAAAHRVGARFPDLRVDLAASENGWRATAIADVFETFDVELFETGEVSTTCRGLRLAEARVTGFGVQALEGRADVEVSGALTEPRISVDARLDASTLAGRRLSHAAARLDATLEPRFSAAVEDAGGWPLELDLQLPNPPAEFRPLPPLRADFRGYLDLRRPELGDRPAFDGSGHVAAAAGVLAWNGVLPLDPVRDAASLRWRFDGEIAALAQLGGDLPATLGGRLAARGSLDGTIAGAHVAADVGVTSLEVARDDWALGGELTGHIEAGHVEAEAGDAWRFDISGLRGQTELRSALLPPLAADIDAELSGEIESAAKMPQLDLRRLVAELGQEGELGRLHLRGALAGESATLELEASELDVATWQRSLGVGLGDADLRGLARLELALAAGGGSELTAEGTLELEQVGASGAGGARVLEGLGARLDLRAARQPPGRIEASASGELGGFLVLWDAYFGDLSMLTTTLDSRFAWHGDGDWSAGLDLRPRTAKQATSLAVQLARLGPRLELRGTLESDDLEDLHAGLLRPFQTEAPALTALAGGGLFEATMDMPADPAPAPSGELSRLDELARLHGRFRLWDGSIRLWQVEADGLELDVPFDLQRRGENFFGPPLVGSLHIAQSRALDLTMPAIQSALSITGDDVALEKPLEIELLGGRVRLERLTARDLLVKPRAESGLILDELSIEQLTRSVGLPALEGRLDGSLPRVAVDAERLQVDGGGRMRLFGGEVRLRDITGRDIFTRFPRFRLSADIDELELGQLTRRFDFGEMRGAISGTIDECVLVGGVPVAFDARFESVEKEGVRQTVDVKAVQNLTILGTGAPTFFDRGLQRFLKRYRYEKLGVAVELRDDLLELRGLIRQGERELFLQGSLFFGIDIVNAVPGQRVSYSTMLRRLDNLDLERVRTE